jgi:hypothetical protein
MGEIPYIRVRYLRLFCSAKYIILFQKLKIIYMKGIFIVVALVFSAFSYSLKAQSTAKASKQPKSYYIDVHHLGAGKVTAADVAGAHKKDLAVQAKHDVKFLKYWVDETKGDVYCLSSASRSENITDAHKEAHGLLPAEVFKVTGGQESKLQKGKEFYLDIHELGAGKVTAKDVAGAHQKDLDAQAKFNVNFVNYWVDEKSGTVICLSQAPDAASVIKTHKAAHGLIPVSVEKVKQGQ